MRLIPILIFICNFASAQFATGSLTLITPEDGGTENYIDFAGWWKLDGNFNDEGGTYDGTGENVSFYADSAALWDDNDGYDYINLGDLITSDTFTISYMIYLDENANENYYYLGNVAGGASGDSGFFAYFDGTGAGSFNINARCNYDGSTEYASTINSDCNSAILDDTWHHIIEIWRGINNSTTHWVCYLDGTPCHEGGASPDSIIGQGYKFQNADVYVGSHSGSTSLTLRNDAMMNSIMIFNYDLKAENNSAFNEIITNPYVMPTQ